MPSKKQMIAEAAAMEAMNIVSDTARYSAFLDTASYHYKYSFRDQLLIFGQKPEATACADIETWNKLGRWVNKGTKGIALLVEQGNDYRLRYVFDIADTNSRANRIVNLWQMKPHYEADVLEALENSFGESGQDSRFGDRIKEIVSHAVDDNLQDYLTQLHAASPGSTLGELDNDTRAIWLRGTVSSSVTYMVLRRCGYEPSEYMASDDLLWILDFNNPATISVLGSATSDISEMVIREIETTVRSLDRSAQQRIHTFASAQPNHYNDGRNQPTERSIEHESDLHNAGRLPDPQSDRSGESEDRQVRDASESISEGASGRAVHRDASVGESEQASGGDRSDSQRDDGSDGYADGDDSGRNGEPESQQSDGLGAGDEQHSERSGGDDSDGADLQLTDVLPSVEEQQVKIQEAEVESASAFAISQEEIDAILLRGGNVYHGKFRIYEQYLLKQSKAENITFLKNEYGVGGSYPAADGVNRTLDEDHDSKGIRIRTGFRVEPQAEVLLSWKKVEKRIGELIEADRYLSPKEKEAYPAYRREREDRAARNTIAEDFRSVIRDYNDFQHQLGNDVAMLNQYVLVNCAASLTAGEKTTWTLQENNYILPLMRGAMQEVISQNTHHLDRAQAVLESLNSPILAFLEPTYDELNPPPPPETEYRFSLGDPVQLGAQEYEILSIDSAEVVLYDPEYPLFNKTLPRAVFDEEVKVNPFNEKYLHIIEEKPAESQKYGEPLNDRIVRFIRDFEFYGDEQTDIGIEMDLTSSDTVAALEERLLSYYEDTDDPGLTETIDGLLAELHEVQVEKTDIAEPAVVGRIDFLGSNGQVGESIEYTDAEKFVSDIREENQSGAPMVITVYRQEDGSTFSTDFLQQLDPPPQGFQIEDNPHLEKSKEDTALSEEQLDELPISTVVDGEVVTYPNAEAMLDAQEQSSVPATMDDVRAAIAQYIVDTFPSEDVDLHDQTYIELAYSSDGEGEHEIQVGADIEEFRFIFEWDNQEIAYIQCSDAADFIAHINNTSFDELIAYAESEHEKQQMRSIPEPPAPKVPKQRTTPHILLPEIHTEDRNNFRITNDDIGVGAPMERYNHNIQAIQLLNKLEQENRLATPEEQRVLSQYVGWGGLPQFFEATNPHYGELRGLLSEDEYTAARESTLTAFYTPPVVIRSMYKAMENMGFRTGNILEPSCGVGNFMGMLPDSMSTSKVYGVELDSISGRIAQQLYQQNSIAVQGFEKTDLPDSFFDAAVGNVPFGQFKVPDKRYDKNNFLIHDYFFARTLDKVRPGGVVAFITSKGTMDKDNPSVRKYIAQRADLLGAIRLPNNTFKSAAGTEVTSDILFLQKRDSQVDIEPDWVHLGRDANGLRINQYFVDNPDMIMGQMQEVMGQYGPEIACIPYEGQDLGEMLDGAIQNIHGQVTEYELDDLPDEDTAAIPADLSVRNFSFTLVDGKIYYRTNSIMNPVEVSSTAANRIKGMIGIRDCVRKLIEYQTEDYPDSIIQQEQQVLNELYDDFSTKYGLINSRANSSAFSTDSSYCLLSSLEVLDDERNFVRKADMFTKRTIKQKVVVTSVDTPAEALALSLAEKAVIDMPYMMELTGK